MKAYHFSKIFTKSMIGFAIVVSLLMAYAFIKQDTRAATACTTETLQVASGANLSQIQINKPVKFVISKVGTGSNAIFKFEVYVFDAADGTSSLKLADTLSAAAGLTEKEVTFTSIGRKELHVRYIEVLDDGTTECPPWKTTDRLNITAVENTAGGSSNIGINFKNSDGSNNTDLKADKGASVKIEYTISGGPDKRYSLQINKGGTACPASSTDPNCWSEKKSGTITATTLSDNYTWNTSSSELGGHQIKIKVYDLTNPANPMTDMKTTVFTLCDPDAAEGSCVGAGEGGAGTGTNEGGADKINTSPLNWTLKRLFGTSDPTKLTLTSIFNPGDKDDSILGRLLKLALDVAGIIAVIMILYASIIYATSYGEESKAELAKKTLTWSVIGLVVLALSQTILTIIWKSLT